MALFGSKSSGNTSECIGINASTYGGPIRGEIELGTHENVLIHIDFDVGRSLGHIYTVLQYVAPKVEKAGLEWCRNTSESIGFKATRFSE